MRNSLYDSRTHPSDSHSLQGLRTTRGLWSYSHPNKVSPPKRQKRVFSGAGNHRPMWKIYHFRSLSEPLRSVGQGAGNAWGIKPSSARRIKRHFLPHMQLRRRRYGGQETIIWVKSWIITLKMRKHKVHLQLRRIMKHF